MGHNRAGVIRKTKLKRRRNALRKRARAQDMAQKQTNQPAVAAQNAEPQK